MDNVIDYIFILNCNLNAGVSLLQFVLLIIVLNLYLLFVTIFRNF